MKLKKSYPSILQRTVVKTICRLQLLHLLFLYRMDLIHLNCIFTHKIVLSQISSIEQFRMVENKPYYYKNLFKIIKETFYLVCLCQLKRCFLFSVDVRIGLLTTRCRTSLVTGQYSAWTLRAPAAHVFSSSPLLQGQDFLCCLADRQCACTSCDELTWDKLTETRMSRGRNVHWRNKICQEVISKNIY
jgi:hypothetical protein